jgi:hypothetical protein
VPRQTYHQPPLVNAMYDTEQRKKNDPSSPILNFFYNWVDSTDWKESDLAMMTPKEREWYERKDQNIFQ